MKLYQSAMKKIDQSQEEVKAQINGFAQEFTPLLSQTDSLYSNIEHSLGATVCHSDDLPRGSVFSHLARLQQELKEADTELRRLGTEYDKCLRFEEDVLGKLRGNGGDFDGGISEMATAEQHKTDEFKKKAEAIAAKTIRLLEDNEAVRAFVYFWGQC